MSSIAAGTTTGTALVSTGNTAGNLVFQTNGATTALTLGADQTATYAAGVIEKKVAIAASDIDLSLGNYFTKTIAGTTTFTVSNVASSGSVSAFVLDLTDGGSATVNWFSGVTWNAATPPTLTASGRDVLAFFTYDGGTTWNAFVLGQGMA
jgi:hypothetical protein